MSKKVLTIHEEKYTKIANTSKDKIIKDRFNVKNEILILEKKVKDINKRIDKLYEDKYNGLFEDEDFTRLYSKQIENRKQTEERIKQLEELEDSSIDINKHRFMEEIVQHSIERFVVALSTLPQILAPLAIAMVAILLATLATVSGFVLYCI